MVNFNMDKWVWSTGKSRASGIGNWWFGNRAEDLKVNFYGPYAEAKRNAIKWAKEQGISTLYLLP